MKMHYLAIFLAFLNCAVHFVFSEPLNLADVPCGNMPKDSRRLFQRIMGGSVADISDFPYAVSLKKHGEHHCGGSLINRYYVLTAAHCVRSYPVDIWTITAGAQQRVVPETHNQTFKADDIVIHEEFQFGKYINDIALIRLSKPVEWNDLAQPICLPDPEVENFAGKHGLLAGWGFDKEGKDGGSLTDQLQFANLPIIDNDECQELFSKYKVKIIDEQVCAGHAEGEIDGCQGDSGGALVSPIDQKLVMVGLMSASLGCGRPNVPGVYTNVPSYVGWINKTISGWNDPSVRRSHLHWTGADVAVHRLKREVLMPLGPLPGLFPHHQSS